LDAALVASSGVVQGVVHEIVGDDLQESRREVRRDGLEVATEAQRKDCLERREVNAEFECQNTTLYTAWQAIQGHSLFQLTGLIKEA